MSETLSKDVPKSDTTLFLYIAVSISSLGGLIYGYDLAGIAGAILFIKKEFSSLTILARACTELRSIWCNGRGLHSEAGSVINLGAGSF